MTSAPNSDRQGTLYVVSTPIGNLRDVTLRALDVLRTAAYVAAEDTRHTAKLLAAHGVRARTVSLHAHSGHGRAQWLVERLLAGEDVAYVTDAGTPAVSDPGTELVDLAHRSGVRVRIVPGASALSAALAVAGLACGDVRFASFASRSRARRLRLLGEVAQTGSGLVLYESPRRVRTLLQEIRETLPDRDVALCREMTKVHEEVLRGRASDLLERLPTEPRGEFTVVVAEGGRGGRGSGGSRTEGEVAARARELRESGKRPREAARALAAELGIGVSEAYAIVLETGKGGDGGGDDDAS